MHKNSLEQGKMIKKNKKDQNRTEREYQDKMSWHIQHRLHHTYHKQHSTDPHGLNHLQLLVCLNSVLSWCPYSSPWPVLLASTPPHIPSPLRILKGLPLLVKSLQNWSHCTVQTSSGFCHLFQQDQQWRWGSPWVHNSPKEEHQTSQTLGNFLLLLMLHLWMAQKVTKCTHQKRKGARKLEKFEKL